VADTDVGRRPVREVRNVLAGLWAGCFVVRLLAWVVTPLIPLLALGTVLATVVWLLWGRNHPSRR
jgi:CHASE2 domain-containing sensor protein